MRDDYKNQMASKVAGRYQDLELRIMKDIVRRIKKTGKITSTADWQINRLLILGYSSEDIEKEIKKTLDASYPKMFELYDKVIDWEYVRNKDIYEQINVEHIPFDQNEQLKQITDAIIDEYTIIFDKSFIFCIGVATLLYFSDNPCSLNAIAIVLISETVISKSALTD